MKFSKKIKLMSSSNIPFTIDDAEDETVVVNIDDKSIKCYLLTKKELLKKEGITFADVYFNEMYQLMKDAENKWGISEEDSMINDIIGLDPDDFSDDSGYDQLCKRGELRAKKNFDKILKRSCFKVEGKYIIENKLYLYLI